MIEVKSLKKSFGSLDAVDGVSFEVDRQETFGLLGPNGAGKTTTISMIIGVLKPNGGSVAIDGVSDPTVAEARRAIGIAPQDIKLSDLKWVIGKAWSVSEGNGKSLINVSVGLKSNEWIKILEDQEERIQLMEAKLKSMENLSEKLKKIEAKVDAIDMN